MNFQRQRKDTIELNLTPLIDVVFILLIFFMVTTTFDREAELKIELPDAGGTEKTVEKYIDVSIDSTGRYFINRNNVGKLDSKDLQKALISARDQLKASQPPIVISADQATTHQAVITLLDAARQVGLLHISYAVDAPPGE